METVTWRRRLVTAVNEEVAAEKAATAAEEDRRRTWWATTWALASVPRTEWAEAQAEYVKRTGHSKIYCDNRRRTGTRLTETMLAHGLPTPRFAEAAANWIGKDGDEAKVALAITLLAEAEKNETSLREFSAALTGRPWTNKPENMTEAEEDAVIESVAKKRPRVIARQATKPTVAKAIVDNHDSQRSVRGAQTKKLVETNKEERHQMHARTQAQRDGIKAVTGQLAVGLNGLHMAEPHMTTALRALRKAVEEREAATPSPDQDARMQIQADEAEILISAYRGISLVDDAALRELLTSGE